MSCPTCDHTMHSTEMIELFWCPRCGTMKLPNGNVAVPKIVNTAKAVCVLQQVGPDSNCPVTISLSEACGVGNAPGPDGP